MADLLPGASRVVLVVEDQSSNLRLLRTTLERAGYRVLEAGDAEEARQALSSTRPDVILMDIQLPGQDGLSFTRELKAQPETADIPVVAVTAYAMAGDEERALAAGCTAYIAKPLDTRALPARLAAILDGAQQAGCPRSDPARRKRTASRAEGPSASAEPAQSTGRVLVIDDERSSRTLIARQLASRGFTVLTAVDGASGLALARDERPDVVLLDLLLPDVDGHEVCRTLRADPLTAAVPIVMLTSLSERRHTLEGLRAGANDFLTKPVDRAELVARVEAQVRIKRLQDQAAEHAAAAVEAEGKRLMAELLESITDGFVAVDDEWRFTYVNERAARVFGRPRAELLGRYQRDLFPELSGTSWELEGLRVMEQRRPAAFEMLFTPANSWLEVHIYPASRGLSIFFQDISSRKRAEHLLVHQALHDPLTSLPNRALLQDRLEQAVLKGLRDSTSFAVLFLDIDQFKDINDVYGHALGDEVLQVIAGRLRRTLRESDTVARTGGDEFVMLIPDAGTVEAVQSTAAKLLKAVQRGLRIREHPFNIEASIGAALFPEHGKDADTLLRRADVAMYIAKRNHLGYAIFSGEPDAELAGRLTLAGELRQAIDGGELVLHYQPKADLQSGTSQGFEALVRWQHPRLGLLGPDAFIPLAERPGLIRPLTGWVLAEALRQVSVWQESGLDTSMAVNLSMRNLGDPMLAETVSQQLQRFGVEPARLTLELTETAIMSDPAHKLELERLQAMGVRLSIDDFGTGYSSLAYLRQLPVDEIKIDRSFVADMESDTDAAVIVRSIVDLGHNLGLKVVAEGVETAGCWNALKELGCDLAQGYYFSRPAAADELTPAAPIQGKSPLAAR